MATTSEPVPGMETTAEDAEVLAEWHEGQASDSGNNVFACKWHVDQALLVRSLLAEVVRLTAELAEANALDDNATIAAYATAREAKAREDEREMCRAIAQRWAHMDPNGNGHAIAMRIDADIAARSKS